MQADLAYQESAKKAERVGSAWRSKKAKAADGLAITARVPAWLRAEIGSKPVLIPDRAETVRRIFRLAGVGLGCKRIVRTLEAEGRAPFLSAGGKQGTAWTPEYVRVILSSRSVLGEARFYRLENGQRVPEGEPLPEILPGHRYPERMERGPRSG